MFLFFRVNVLQNFHDSLAALRIGTTGTTRGGVGQHADMSCAGQLCRQAWCAGALSVSSASFDIFFKLRPSFVACMEEWFAIVLVPCFSF